MGVGAGGAIERGGRAAAALPLFSFLLVQSADRPPIPSPQRAPPRQPHSEFKRRQKLAQKEKEKADKAVSCSNEA
jgi:hypothetical protein